MEHFLNYNEELYSMYLIAIAKETTKIRNIIAIRIQGFSKNKVLIPKKVFCLKL